MTNLKMPNIRLPNAPYNTKQTEPEILWSIHGKSRSCFPTCGELSAQRSFLKNEFHRNSMINAIEESFLYSILESEERLWIIDPYFFEIICKGISVSYADVILEMLEQIDSKYLDIRILSSSNEIDLDAWQARSDKVLSSKNFAIDIHLIRSFPIHDRFVIVDNELWHFGGSIGLLLPSLNAVSRGWDIYNTRAIEFFEELWNQYTDRK
jgi:hypothetical protein